MAARLGKIEPPHMTISHDQRQSPFLRIKKVLGGRNESFRPLLAVTLPPQVLRAAVADSD